MEKIKLNIQKFASGTVWLGTSGNLEGQIVWWSSSNGSSANSSNVHAELQIHRNNSATTTGTFSYYFQTGGVGRQSTWYGSISNSWKTIDTIDTTIGHNADGTGSCYMMSWVTGPSGTSLAGKTVSNNATVTLDKIDRFALISGADNFNDEGTPKVSFSNPASFDLQFQLKVGNTQISVVDKPTKTSPYSFNLTDEQRNQLRQFATGNTLTVTYVVGTYVNGSIANWSTLNKTMNIVNANTIFSNFEFDDINPITLALTGNSKVNVNNYSTIRAKISVADKSNAIKFATTSKYRFTIDTQTIDIPYSSDSEVYGDISNSKIGIYNVYAIDSRNNSTLVTKLAQNNIEYENIYLDPQQCNVSRTDNGVGGGAILNYNGTIWDKNFGVVTNSIKSIKYYFKKTNSEQWILGQTNIMPNVSDGRFSFNGLVRSDKEDTTFDLDSSYNFRIEISDELSTSIIELTPLQSARPHIAFADNGIGLMGKYDENNGGLVQVGGVPLEIPTGSILPYASDNIIGGWLLCDGRAVSRTTYNNLFKVIGTTYGAGDGNSTFNIPNLCGRVPVGKSGDTEFNKLGKTGGEKTHKLTEAELAWHKHSIAQRGHGATSDSGQTGNINFGSWWTGGLETGYTGGDQPHNNLQPYITINYIIKS